ncbi:MAG TPA: hypothetical protein VGR26_07945 [Acidimicrobiales bacterium]|nr:hypothetical protein [Acidimicrobiales bacterium]
MLRDRYEEAVAIIEDEGLTDQSWLSPPRGQSSTIGRSSRTMTRLAISHTSIHQ